MKALTDKQSKLTFNPGMANRSNPITTSIHTPVVRRISDNFEVIQDKINNNVSTTKASISRNKKPSNYWSKALNSVGNRSPFATAGINKSDKFSSLASSMFVKQ